MGERSDRKVQNVLSACATGELKCDFHAAYVTSAFFLVVRMQTEK